MSLAKPIVILLSLLLFGFLELRSPFFHYRSSLFQRMAKNFGLGLLNFAVITLFLKLVQPLMHPLPLQLQLPISPAIAGVLNFLILDLFHYHWHGLMHCTQWGWALHRVHHSEQEMNVSTSYRFHPIEILLSSIPKTGLVILFGMTPIQVLVYELCFSTSVIFHHSNWYLSDRLDRLLSLLFVTPHLHRVHHSSAYRDDRHNLATVFSLWDRLGGSFRYPRQPKRLKLGIYNPIDA